MAIKQNFEYRGKSSIKRKGIHAKRKDSRSKTSKNYKKPYVGQGY